MEFTVTNLSLEEMKAVMQVLNTMRGNAPAAAPVKTDVSTSDTPAVKRGPGRPRKNAVPVEPVEKANPIDWLKKKDDVLHLNIRKRTGWKCLNARKDRTANTHKFYISQEFAEKAAEALGIDKTNIYIIRPTAAAKDYENYPKFYFIEQNWTIETARDARCQYIQLWNRNHAFKLPQDITLHLSTKSVFKKSRARKAKTATA